MAALVQLSLAPVHLELRAMLARILCNMSMLGKMDTAMSPSSENQVYQPSDFEFVNIHRLPGAVLAQAYPMAWAAYVGDIDSIISYLRYTLNFKDHQLLYQQFDTILPRTYVELLPDGVFESPDVLSRWVYRNLLVQLASELVYLLLGSQQLDALHLLLKFLSGAIPGSVQQGIAGLSVLLAAEHMSSVASIVYDQNLPFLGELSGVLPQCARHLDFNEAADQLAQWVTVSESSKSWSREMCQLVLSVPGTFVRFNAASEVEILILASDWGHQEVQR
ncbi:hypothetical protein H4R35_005325 [Dimargaris xerosporica]|nr:hypothetical protein H4R35_005325 [Dimargaris xerosporica]